MTTNERLVELKEMAGELEKLIGKLSLLNDMTAGTLAESRTVMEDVVNAVKWAQEGK